MQMEKTQQELKEFTKAYFQDKELRKQIWDKHGLSIDYGEWDECFELWSKKDGVIDMERSWFKLVEKLFYMVKQNIYLNNQTTSC